MKSSVIQALLLQLNQSPSELKMLEHSWGQFELPLHFSEAWVHQIGKQDFITSGILSFSTGLHFTQSQLQLLPKDSCFWCGEQPFSVWSGLCDLFYGRSIVHFNAVTFSSLAVKLTAGFDNGFELCILHAYLQWRWEAMMPFCRFSSP